jgi:hypothetical protein
MRDKNSRELLFCPPLLSTESKAEFDALDSSLRKEIKPRGVIERIYTDNFIERVWDLTRLARVKIAIYNLAIRKALYDVLVEELGELEGGQETVKYLDGWLNDPEIKQEISDMLAKYNLDESAIEAGAFRQCCREFELIERLIVSAELRRERALHNLAFYREGLALQLESKASEVMRKVIPRYKPEGNASEHAL